jgi:hypothetical protein
MWSIFSHTLSALVCCYRSSIASNLCLRIASIASQKRSNSALGSLSVGSIINGTCNRETHWLVHEIHSPSNA